MKSVESWDGFQQQKGGKKMQDNKPVDPKYFIKLGTPIRKSFINGYCANLDNDCDKIVYCMGFFYKRK